MFGIIFIGQFLISRTSYDVETNEDEIPIIRNIPILLTLAPANQLQNFIVSHPNIGDIEVLMRNIFTIDRLKQVIDMVENETRLKNIPFSILT